MFDKKEKWSERNGREKWRENKKLRCLVGGKNSKKRKLDRRKSMWGSPKAYPPKLEKKPSGKLVCFTFTKLILKRKKNELYKNTNTRVKKVILK